MLMPPSSRSAESGPLACPLTPWHWQCHQLMSVAQLAPYARYGVGKRTLVDVSVWRCWQVEASAVQLHSAVCTRPRALGLRRGAAPVCAASAVR